MMRVGISMRIAESPNYFELRDCLAHDWSTFFHNFPEWTWGALPNIGEAIVSHVKKWDMNAFILSGGNDIGEYPLRDCTELSLLAYARAYGIPVLGVCRGMQVMHTFFGGRLTTSQELKQKHNATTHPISWKKTDIKWVNSYHAYSLEGPFPYEILATAEDETVESFRKDTFLGVMWHPERETSLPPWQKHFIKQHIERT